MILAVFWIFPCLPISAWVVFNMPPEWAMMLLLFFSLWALTASHWAAYQAVMAERKADSAN
jgi:hypothetical protein